MDVKQNRTKVTNRYRAEKTKVRNKIINIIDKVCLDDCPQNVDGVCRAFETPHSVEEREQRSKKTISGESRNCSDQTVIDKHYAELKYKRGSKQWRIKD